MSIARSLTILAKCSDLCWSTLNTIPTMELEKALKSAFEKVKGKFKLQLGLACE